MFGLEVVLQSNHIIKESSASIRVLKIRVFRTLKNPYVNKIKGLTHRNKVNGVLIMNTQNFIYLRPLCSELLEKNFDTTCLIKRR